MNRALISVSDKTGVVDFAIRLIRLGWEIVSTGRTSEVLRSYGIGVANVSEITGYPECFGGRVKTMHPKILGGILFRSGELADVAQALELGIDRINLVVVNLYPFEQTIAKPGVAFKDAIENIDIGGPTMLRSAAKNHEDATVICDPADYEPFLHELEKHGEVSDQTRLVLAQKVFVLTAKYDGAIAKYLLKQIKPIV